MQINTSTQGATFNVVIEPGTDPATQEADRIPALAVVEKVRELQAGGHVLATCIMLPGEWEKETATHQPAQTVGT